jgi:hypothetical protein
MKPRYQGFGDGFTVLDKPGPECYGDNGSILRFVDNAGIFAVLEGWFDVLEEGDRQRVALVDVGNKAVESSFGIVVGKETDIFKFPAEDCKKKKMVRDWAKKRGDPRLEQAAYYR